MDVEEQIDQDRRQEENDAVEPRLTQQEKRERDKKLFITFSIAVSFLCVACFKSVVGPTLVNLSKIVNVDLSYFPVIFCFRSVGYVLGCIVGGYCFDHITLNYYRQLLILAMSLITGSMSLCFPFCKNLLGQSAVFLVAGLGLSCLDIGLNAYILHIWHLESKIYLHVIHSVYGIGYLIGPILARVFITDFQRGLDDTFDLTDPKNMSQLLYVYVSLGAMFLVVSAFWILVIIMQASNKKECSKRFQSSKVTNNCFTNFAISSTCLLIFIVGSIDIGYQHILASFGFFTYGLSTVESANLTAVFWSMYAVGSIITMFLSMRFHARFLILLCLAIEITAAIVLIFLAENSPIFLTLANMLLGLGASSLFSNTILCLETYVCISHKLMALMIFSMSISEMVTPAILGTLLEYRYLDLTYYVLSIPILYLVVFMVQILIYYPQDERPTTELNTTDTDERQKRICPVFLLEFIKFSNISIPLVQTEEMEMPNSGTGYFFWWNRKLDTSCDIDTPNGERAIETENEHIVESDAESEIYKAQRMKKSKAREELKDGSYPCGVDETTQT